MEDTPEAMTRILWSIPSPPPPSSSSSLPVSASFRLDEKGWLEYPLASTVRPHEKPSVCVLRTRTGNTPGDAQDPATILLRKCGIRNVNSSSSRREDKIDTFFRRVSTLSLEIAWPLITVSKEEEKKEEKKTRLVFLNDETFLLFRKLKN